MDRWRVLLLGILLVLAGCSGQHTLESTPDRPDTLTDETMVTYAAETERVHQHNRIVEQVGRIEGDLNVTCGGTVLARTDTKTVVGVACRADPYVADDAHVETVPRFSLYVLGEGSTDAIREIEAESVQVNASTRGSLWVVNADASAHTLTVQTRTEGTTNATTVGRYRVNATTGRLLDGLEDRETNVLDVGIDDQRVSLDHWDDDFRTTTVVYVSPGGSLRSAVLDQEWIYGK